MSRGLVFFVVSLMTLPTWAERYAVESVYNSLHEWTGEGRSARSVFLYPQDLTVDNAGNLYVIHFWGRLVVKIGTDGIAHRVAGGGTAVPANGLKATDVNFFPRGIAVDGSGALYVTDSSRYQIYKIATDGRISIYAGTGTRGFSGDDGPATEATLMTPLDMGIDDAGNLYFADNFRIRRITPGGTIRTVAGNGNSGAPIDGAKATESPISPQALAVEPSGELLVSPLRTYPIYRVTVDGMLRRVAGSGSAQGSAGFLDDIKGIAGAPDGSVYTTQMWNSGRVRKIAGGAVSTVAGTTAWTISGDGGPAALANISNPGAIHVDRQGRIWFADHLTVRRITDGQIETVAGSHAAAVLSDGGTFAEADTRRIATLTQDRNKNFYIADALTHSVYRISPDLKQIQRIAGTGFRGFTTEAGTALQTPLNWPSLLDIDAAGNIYIGEALRIRRLTPGGQLESFAGVNEDEDFSEGARALDFYIEPTAMRRGPSGDLYVASRSRIFRIGPDGRAHGVTETTGIVYGMDFDADGNLYFSETSHRLRKVSTTGAVTTIAGTGTAGFAGDGGPASAAQFNRPEAVAVDDAGNVLVSDASNHRVRRINKAGIIETVLGGGPAYGNGWESTSVALTITTGFYTIPGGIHIGDNGTIWAVDASRVTRMDPARIFSNWVFNAASFQLGPVAPGEIVTFYGEDIGPEALTSAVYENGRLQTALAGTKVLFNGIESPLVYVSRTQGSAIVPYGASGTITMQVEYQGNRTNTITLDVGPALPGLFTYAGGTGQIVAVNQDSQFNGTATPAKAGEWVVIFLTGQGVVAPATGDGMLPSGPNWPAATGGVEISVGGVAVAPNEIWNGLIFQGVLQLNFRLPGNAPKGATELVVGIAGANSQASATIAIQ